MVAGPTCGAGRHFGERSRSLMISNGWAGRSARKGFSQKRDRGAPGPLRPPALRQRLHVPSGNLKFDRTPRPVMSRSMTRPKPDLPDRLGPKVAGPARGAGRHSGERSRAAMSSNVRARVVGLSGRDLPDLDCSILGGIHSLRTLASNMLPIDPPCAAR